MQYTFTEKDKKTREERVVVVPLERWIWGVVYEDGTELRQFENNGTFHQFLEVDQDRVAMFVMINTEDPSKRVDVEMVPGSGVQVFHFYRHMVLNVGTEQERRVKVYAFGWKYRKTELMSYHFILPDDRMVAADHDILDLTIYEV